MRYFQPIKTNYLASVRSSLNIEQWSFFQSNASKPFFKIWSNADVNEWQTHKCQTMSIILSESPHPPWQKRHDIDHDFVKYFYFLELFERYKSKLRFLDLHSVFSVFKPQRTKNTEGHFFSKMIGTTCSISLILFITFAIKVSGFWYKFL